MIFALEQHRSARNLKCLSVNEQQFLSICSGVVVKTKTRQCLSSHLTGVSLSLITPSSFIFSFAFSFVFFWGGGIFIYDVVITTCTLC